MTPARRPRSSRVTALSLAALVGLGPLACNQPTGSTSPRSSAPTPPPASNPAPTEVAAPEPAPTTAPPPISADGKTRPILGQKTTDVRDAQAETKAGGAVATTPRITAKDPITLTGNAYVSIVGQSQILNIKHAVDLYQAETGEFPKTFAEFQEKILRANNIALPTLPYYQEYGYDTPSHSLVILEYPDRKAAANAPR